VASENFQKLKESTLLLKDLMLRKNQISSADLKSFYPFSSRITTHDSIHQSIFDNQDVVYVQITPQLKNDGDAYRLGYEHILMNAKTGIIVSYLRISTGIRNKYISLGILDKYVNINIDKDYDRDTKPDNFVSPDERE
jgi:hypothetical protein